MQCKSCGFSVPQNLKFAIMKNFCPQCGNKLFSEREMNHLATIQNRVGAQEFSKKLTEQQIYDISLFLYNEISNGYGRVIIDEYLKELMKNKKLKATVETVGVGEPLPDRPSDSADEESDNEEYEEEDSEEDINLDEELDIVKTRIREEEAARVALGHGADRGLERGLDEDQESKVNRLRELHKNSMLKPRNPVVRRIES